MRLISFLLFLFIAGCATTPQPTSEKYEKLLNSWIGEDQEKLVLKWGAPEQSFRAPKGMVLTYVVTGNTYRETFYDSLMQVSRTYETRPWCKTNFLINADGKIDAWHHEGDACRAFD